MASAHLFYYVNSLYLFIESTPVTADKSHDPEEKNWDAIIWGRPGLCPLYLLIVWLFSLPSKSYPDALQKDLAGETTHERT